MLIEDLTQPVDTVKGVGMARKKLFNRLGIYTIKDLLLYYPRAFSDRTSVIPLKEADNGSSVTVKVRVMDHRMIGSKYRRFLKVLIEDNGTYGALLCFNRNFLAKSLIIGEEFYITGKFIRKYNEFQCSSFEFERTDSITSTRIIPVYSLTAGLQQPHIRDTIEMVLDKYANKIDDELPTDIVEKNKLFSKKQALINIHRPESFKMFYQARNRLIYDEFFKQKFIALSQKEKQQKIKKIRSKCEFKYRDTVINSLPFELMDYQKDALSSLEKAIFSDNVFSILLQADVGAGKTILSLLAMLSVVESGGQCAIMAPTEVLARQHYETIRKFTADLWLDTALLTGSLKKKEKDNILSGIKSGEIKIIAGTHALFSDDVIFNDLHFIVVDEQHRFGVGQRYKLASKGTSVDTLLMTATPIPQSLSHVLFGEMDFIMMKGVISGRMPVKTWVITDDKQRKNKMHKWIGEELDNGGKAIFVYPTIEDGDENRKSLIDEYSSIEKIYDKWGSSFIHSKKSSEEKKDIIDKFRNGDIQVIASTTVVEVGLDVPDATIIVVEGANYFGLSTLHQLRGRVGRNNRQGYMVLITPDNELSDDAVKRMEIMQRENDGFIIAEEDLKLRGPGEFLGNRQSGYLDVKLANWEKDLSLLKKASKDAETLQKEDPNLTAKEHTQLAKSILFKIKNLD